MNSWSFTGNLGKAAEQRFTGAGDSIVSFSVATKAGFGDKATTTWARCSIFGKRGESVLPYLQKGQLVGIIGEMSAREWDNKEGVKQTSIEVRVNDLTLLGKKEDGSAQQASEYPPAQQSAPQRQAPSKTYDHGDDLSSDIPF
jgi:single-strand DNA-binding protein